MLDRTDLDPVFFAPFVSSLMHVEPQWIDYNGHLNMAYYNVLFDRAVDEVYELIGIGADYLKRAHHSTFTAEVHVRYVRELHANDPVRVTFQLLDFDSKRFHYFEQLFHATEGWVSATSENMTLHGNKESRRIPRLSHARACAHEDSPCATAASGGRHPPHRDAWTMMRSIFPRFWRRRRSRLCRRSTRSARSA